MIVVGVAGADARPKPHGPPPASLARPSPPLPPPPARARTRPPPGLAAASDVVGVTLGGIVGHALCTGAAVLGGKHLAEHIDERMVAYFGAVLFLLFGAHSLWTGVPE